MVKLSELVFDRNAFPLRLIDLQSTLASSGGVCFQLPSDWNFHVVSHTWSQDIRDLSVAVGHVLLESGWSTDQELNARGLRYNEAFAEPRFAKNSSYEKLMEFFQVLVADGASHVWFDALCINQKDDHEKAREIRRMGAYYRLSAGCYVITHGIGSELGFKAATTKSLEPVPRWFTRAWTIQESILPEKLSFIVEKFDGTSIKQFYSEEQFLSILSEQWRDWDEPLGPIEWEKKMGDVSRRRAYKEFYCLGADAYRRMMQIALHPAWQWSKFKDAFSELADTDIHDHDIDVESVVKIVQQRHCSVEEDRVLSILGLLGILRTHTSHVKILPSLRLSLHSCELTLLMLRYCHPCDYPYTLAMACVGTTEEMQKVGILGFTPHEDIDFSSSFEDCLIGGFGDDLTCFLNEECRPFLPRVLSSPSENTLNQHSEDILSQHSEEDLEVLPQ